MSLAKILYKFICLKKVFQYIENIHLINYFFYKKALRICPAVIRLTIYRPFLFNFRTEDPGFVDVAAARCLLLVRFLLLGLEALRVITSLGDISARLAPNKSITRSAKWCEALSARENSWRAFSWILASGNLTLKLMLARQIS